MPTPPGLLLGLFFVFLFPFGKMEPSSKRGEMKAATWVYGNYDYKSPGNGSIWRFDIYLPYLRQP